MVVIVLFVLLWITFNLLPPAWSIPPIDVVPFHLLQGIVALAALLTTTVVLIKQNRVARLDEQRSHPALKVALLIEPKNGQDDRLDRGTRA